MRIALSIAALILSCGVALADPVGHYSVAGTNPGGDGKYSGDVTVSKTGDTYKVVWHVGSDTYIGTGVGNDEFIAVSYKSGNDSGLALYTPDKGGAWSGIWTYAGSTKIGTEAWAQQ